MKPQDQEEWRTAVHEAGHVVAAALMNVPINGVTIVPDDEALGRIRYEGVALQAGGLAGAAAELAILGDVCAAGLGNDRERAAELGPLTRAVWRTMCQEMRLHRGEVLAVAMRLRQQQTLGVLDLYDKVLPALVPTASHPRLRYYEKSYSEWAAEQDAEQDAEEWEPDDDSEDTLRLPQPDQAGEPDLPFA